MNIVVLRELQEGEARVALMPESVKKLAGLGAVVRVESGAGLNAARTDDDFRDAGAEVSTDREALLSDADVLAVVNRPAPNDFARLKTGMMRSAPTVIAIPVTLVSARMWNNNAATEVRVIMPARTNKRTPASVNA